MKNFVDFIKNNWFLILIGLWFIYSIFFTADRDSIGNVTRSGWVNPDELRVGDCILDNSFIENLESEDETYYQYWVTPCEQEHSTEIYYKYDLGKKYLDFPGDEALPSIIDEICVPAFESFVGLTGEEIYLDYSSETEDLAIAAYTPLEESWLEMKSLDCVAYNINGELMIGSVKDLIR
tara:strand:+ start:294 stop:830 length:537 start_codon:yes stop_codon:yes gene_type:complete